MRLILGWTVLEGFQGNGVDRRTAGVSVCFREGKLDANLLTFPLPEILAPDVTVSERLNESMPEELRETLPVMLPVVPPLPI